jgi:phospholipid/cholesterol/gamma-HCH transport system substrate-binding protein
MDHRIPRVGLVLSIVCAVAAAITFVFLNESFEGPSVTGALGGPYELEAPIADAEAMPTKQPVLVRGVEVGKVTEVIFDHATSTATIRFTVDEGELGPVHRDARATIGERTLLGDPYVNLDPGHASAGDLESGESVRTAPSVDFDEGFDFLDERGRRHVTSLIGTLRDATRSDDGGEDLNATVGELSRTIDELNTLTDELRGQEDDLTGLVGDGAVVLGELGSRERAVREIVASGRTALEALASGEESLRAGVEELPRVLESGREALARARPLIDEARPVVADLRRGAPDLTLILGDVAPLFEDAIDSIAGLAAVPSLRKVLEVVTVARPLAPKLAPAARNLVGALRYTAPRAPGIAAFFANMAGATAHGDSTARWARFAILFEPGELADNPTPATCQPEDDVTPNAGFCHNAYPPPGDAADPEPYEPGSYPRVDAYDPP